MRVLLIDAREYATPELDYIGLGLAYLAAYLRQLMPEVGLRIVNRDLDGQLKDFRPHLVGVSSVSVAFNAARAIARVAKRRGVPVVVGGHHVSALPGSLSEDMDLGVVGEGEVTFARICRILAEDGWSRDRLRSVRGIAYRREDGTVITTPPRPPLRDLDVLPFPARDLLRRRERRRPILYSSRGCPYSCAFCSPSRFWGKVRWFSAEYVVREIRYLADELGARSVYFADDLLTANRPRLRRIVERVEAAGLPGRVEFNVPCRANLVDPDLVSLLRRMHVVETHLGLESGDAATLRFLKGRNVSVEDNRRAVDLLSAAHIRVVGNVVLGAPDETRRQALETLAFIRRAPLADLRCYPLSALPGTPVWDRAYRRGLVSEDMDWSLCWNHRIDGRSLILSEQMGREELRGIERRVHGERIRKKWTYRLSGGRLLWHSGRPRRRRTGWWGPEAGSPADRPTPVRPLRR